MMFVLDLIRRHPYLIYYGVAASLGWVSLFLAERV